jgi:two-component system phosphate regulon sensor histidine kinase PhoR
MNERISLNLFYMGIFSAVIAILVTAVAFYYRMEDQVKEYLQEESRVITQVYSYLETPESLAPFASDIIRITLIDSLGHVLFESEKESAEMGNHLNRSEIQSALKTGSGESFRFSSTLETDVYYFAQKLPDGHVLRLSMRKTNLFSIFSSVYPYLILLFIAIVLLSIISAFFLTKLFLKPIHEMISRLDSEHVVDDDTLIYHELVPFIVEINKQRKNTQHELKRLANEKEKLSVLMKNMPEGLLFLDEHKNVVMINEEARSLLHVQEEHELRHIIYYSRNLHLNNLIDKAFLGKRISEEISLNGMLYQVLASPVIVLNEFVGIICLFMDLSAKNKVEQLRREFTANASHELKTPLTSILGYAEMIENNMVKTEDVPRIASKIHNESKRMLMLTEDIMKLAELDEVRSEEVAKDSVDLLAVAQECASSLEPITASKKIVMEVKGIATKIQGNRRLLFEMIYNLMDNAIRYNSEGGSVLVLVDEKSISVRDTGIGIPEKSQERIFERFYRVDKSRSKETGGTGLGLAIVKHVAETHYAKVILDSKENKGTEIRIQF